MTGPTLASTRLLPLLLAARLKAGESWQGEDWVFCHTDGRMLPPNVVSRWFLKLTQPLGFPRITFHDLRHSGITAMIRSGIPIKVVSERVGHASTAFTMDVYAAVLPDMQDDAAAVIGGMFGRAVQG